MLRPSLFGSASPPGRGRPGGNTCIQDGGSQTSSISSLADHSQNLIHQEWIKAGKPHNFICSTCRKPGNLIYCTTCCRSYHLPCLSAPPVPEELANWSCPACRERQDVMAAVTNAPFDSASPMATRSNTPGSGSVTAKSSPQMHYQPSISAHSTALSHGADDSFERERKFLIEYGDFPPHQEFKRDLLVQLRRLIQGVELHAPTRRELDALRSENARLRKENAQLKASVKSRWMHHGSLYGVRRSPSASRADTSLDSIEALKPPDVSEKSWDRIITDAF
ncbi:hypothetical protein VTN77DRAFT_4765 [Rasamsonia byssochlamydoides]|uniref:uncharacterized protein n=1 Tax=Rasamsonia byssochlamydoides TaxID=89139 RepID=UPI003744A19E